MEDNKFITAKHAIDKMFQNNIGSSIVRSSGITNVVNRIGKNLGYEQLSSEDSDLYEAISEYLQGKIQTNKMGKNINEAKRALMETSFEISTPKSIARYDDDIVVDSIKDIMAKKFDNVTLEKITGNEGGALYDLVVAMELEDDIRNDMERKRFYISQVTQRFKAKFTTELSSVLPVINSSVGSYDYTKNSTTLRFQLKLCLSHTDDRDWVSGSYRGKDDLKRLTTEASAPKRSTIKALSLAKIIQRFNNGQIDKKMLETGIKASGRNELEIYIMKSLGLDVEVDMTGIDADTHAADKSKPTTSIDTKDGKAYDPNQKITEQ